MFDRTMAERPDDYAAGMRSYLGGVSLPGMNDTMPADSVLGAPSLSPMWALVLGGGLVWLMLRKG